MMIRNKENEHFKIYQRVFNEKALDCLARLSMKGYFKTLDYPIATGKEADVYRATTKTGYVALKIYRIETSYFKHMQNYILGDPRFQDFRRTKRGIVTTWCQKEHRNLEDAYKVVRVPKPIKFMENVLVMEFIGKKGVPAKTLKDVGCKDWSKTIAKLVDMIRILYKKTRLVHADFSEFNILMLDDEPVLIDMGQAVSIKHPNAKVFLMRDLYNLENLAKKNNVKFNAKKEYEKLVK